MNDEIKILHEDIINNILAQNQQIIDSNRLILGYLFSQPSHTISQEDSQIDVESLIRKMR